MMVKPEITYVNNKVADKHQQLKKLSKEKIFINKTCKSILNDLGHDIVNTILDNMVVGKSPIYIKDLNNEKIHQNKLYNLLTISQHFNDNVQIYKAKVTLQQYIQQTDKKNTYDKLYNKYIKLINQYFEMQKGLDTTLQNQQTKLQELQEQLKQCRNDKS